MDFDATKNARIWEKFSGQCTYMYMPGYAPAPNIVIGNLCIIQHVGRRGLRAL
jgi:hypothetical protein